VSAEKFPGGAIEGKKTSNSTPRKLSFIRLAVTD